MNCILADDYGRVLPFISRELEGTFPAKCKGPARGLGVEFKSLVIAVQWSRKSTVSAQTYAVRTGLRQMLRVYIS